MTNTNNRVLTLIASGIFLVGCSSSASDPSVDNIQPIDESIALPVNNALTSDLSNNQLLEDATTTLDLSRGLAPDEVATYTVTIENLWGLEEYPQGFPNNAHLSLIGGATHNASVSFWESGELASPGMEDMAEAGLIDKLLFDEVAPAIDNGTADGFIEVREFTNAKIDGAPGVLTFTLEMKADYPLVSLATMLGPSPDWFVGVSGLSLQIDDSWATELSVDLPLYDAGTKSDITPIMGGPDIIPPNPIALVAYDAATGVYLASDEQQIMARLTFERIE